MLWCISVKDTNPPQKKIYSWTIARDLLIKVCTMKCEEIHLVLYHYVSPSTKDLERKNRGALNNSKFIITGSNQVQRLSGIDVLKNGAFKEEFFSFIVQEWKKPQYGPILRMKLLYVSQGGKYVQYRNMEAKDGSQVVVEEFSQMQACHEEADTISYCFPCFKDTRL